MYCYILYFDLNNGSGVVECYDSVMTTLCTVALTLVHNLNVNN